MDNALYFFGDRLIICGIEEAGRGPVIGPMVICGVNIDDSKDAELKEIGVKDSKLLTSIQRRELFPKIKKIAKDFKIIIVKPAEIDKALQSESTNLNWLTADKFIEIVNELKPGIAYVDCPSTNVSAFKEYMKERITSKKTKLIVEHKADARYPAVSAASIMAKVTRDKEIEKIKKKYNIDIGSGYPADPFTKQFLEKNYNKYPIFRKSWASWKNVAKKNGQRKLKF